MNIEWIFIALHAFVFFCGIYSYESINGKDRIGYAVLMLTIALGLLGWTLLLYAR
jgi:hypothetical protein